MLSEHVNIWFVNLNILTRIPVGYTLAKRLSGNLAFVHQKTLKYSSE